MHSICYILGVTSHNIAQVFSKTMQQYKVTSDSCRHPRSSPSDPLPYSLIAADKKHIK